MMFCRWVSKFIDLGSLMEYLTTYFGASNIYVGLSDLMWRCKTKYVNSVSMQSSEPVHKHYQTYLQCSNPGMIFKTPFPLLFIIYLYMEISQRMHPVLPDNLSWHVDTRCCIIHIPPWTIHWTGKLRPEIVLDSLDHPLNQRIEARDCAGQVGPALIPFVLLAIVVYLAYCKVRW